MSCIFKHSKIDQCDAKSYQKLEHSSLECSLPNVPTPSSVANKPKPLHKDYNLS